LNSETALAGLPEGARSLLGSVEVYAALDAVDLREMSKFSERTNVWGLPVHPILSPPDPDGLLESSGWLEDLPTAVFVKLRETLRAQPQILLRGEFAGTMSHTFPVAATFPQDAAHIARVWNELLWRGEEPTTEPALTVVHLPDFEEPILLSLPDEGVALILGTDDLRPGLFVALEWANRHWNARNELIQLKKLPREAEPQVILAGGSYVFEDRPIEEGSPPAPTLIYPGESIPVSWEEIVRESLSALGGLKAEDLLLAEAEPWCAGGGGHAAPFWRNPMLPAPLLELSAKWRESALHPDAVPFGLTVDEAGDIDWNATPEEAFVVAPRSAVPPPFPAVPPLYAPGHETRGHAVVGHGLSLARSFGAGRRPLTARETGSLFNACDLNPAIPAFMKKPGKSD